MFGRRTAARKGQELAGLLVGCIWGKANSNRCTPRGGWCQPQGLPRIDKARYEHLGTCDWKGTLMIIDSTCAVSSECTCSWHQDTDHTSEEGATQNQ